MESSPSTNGREVQGSINLWPYKCENIIVLKKIKLVEGATVYKFVIKTLSTYYCFPAHFVLVNC